MAKQVLQHVAIIMDGNGRWARRRGLPRTEGHRRGMKAALAMLDSAILHNVKYLTLYAFSSENWKRPKEEVAFLMQMCEAMITRELPGLIKKNIRLRHVGRMEELPLSLQRCMQNAMELTKHNNRLNLQMAFNYGSRTEILDAVKKIAAAVKDGFLKLDEITEPVFDDALYTKGIPDPDLLIRTSGEMRVSNYLLWQIAYAEIYVVKKYWPDFTGRDLAAALKDFGKRRRRFGGVDD